MAPRALLAVIMSASLLGHGCFHESEDSANICVLPAGNTIFPERFEDSGGSEEIWSYEVGEPLVITAKFRHTTDDKIRVMDCAAEVEGDEIEIRTRFKWRGPGSDALLSTVVTCETEALPAGEYTIRYDGSEMRLQIPSEGTAPCLGEDF